MISDSLISEFTEYQAKNRRMSPHTILAYSNDLGDFKKYLDDSGFEDGGTPQTSDIRGWMASMMDSGLAVKSIHRKISSLRSYFKYLRRQKVISEDPLSRIIMPKTPKKIVQDIPSRDLENMFRNFPWQEEEYGARDRLTILLLYTTGMRLSELIGLKRSDVDFRRNNITVTGKRNKQRIIPIHPELADWLKNYLANTEGLYLITTPAGKKAYPMFIYRIVTRYLRLFSSAFKTSPHVLRHSFATHMLNNGAQLMAIKELLGHASLSATQVYTKNSFEKLRAVHKLHPRG